MNSNLVIRQLLSALSVATTHLQTDRMEVLAATKAAREWLVQDEGVNSTHTPAAATYTRLPSKELRTGECWPKDVMREWGHWREAIANGFTGSAPRDWFESLAEMRLVALEKSKPEGEPVAWVCDVLQSDATFKRELSFEAPPQPGTSYAVRNGTPLYATPPNTVPASVVLEVLNMLEAGDLLCEIFAANNLRSALEGK